MIVTVFRSRLRTETEDEYRSLATKMNEIARSMPGLHSFKTFTADDGERVSIIEFDTLPQHDAWRKHFEHRKAKELGRERFYLDYQIRVCRTVRSYSFERGK